MANKTIYFINHSRKKNAKFVNNRKSWISSTDRRKKWEYRLLFFENIWKNLWEVFYDYLTKFIFFCNLLTKFLLFLLFFDKSSIFRSSFWKSVKFFGILWWNSQFFTILWLNYAFLAILSKIRVYFFILFFFYEIWIYFRNLENKKQKILDYFIY